MPASSATSIFYLSRAWRRLLRELCPLRRGDLPRERAVRDRAPRRRVVHQDGHAMARALGHPYVPRDDGAEHLVAEVGPDLVLYLAREAVPAVEHREEKPLERQGRGQRVAHPPD